MTYSHAFHRFALAFGTAFAVLYVVTLKLDLALFTVYPSLGVIVLGTQHSRDTVDPALAFLAPAMYWYGWAATAVLGALVVGVIAALLPGQWTQRRWLGRICGTAALAMLACVYLTLPWFRLLERRLTLRGSIRLAKKDARAETLTLDGVPGRRSIGGLPGRVCR